MMEWFTETFLIPLLATIATGAIAAAAAKFTALSGIQIEARHRDALHSALMTGVRMALEKFGPGASKTEVVEEALRYTDRSVPDALSRLNPSPAILRDIAQAKVEEVKSQKGL